jgi:hypothetical protein
MLRERLGIREEQNHNQMKCEEDQPRGKGNQSLGGNWLSVGYPTFSAASRQGTCQSLSFFLYILTSTKLTSIEQIFEMII